MRREAIKRHIDDKIIRELMTKSPDVIRQELCDTCMKFEKNIIELPTELTIESIENIQDVRSRYLSLYVHLAKQRILDLYKVEIKDIYGWDYRKKFKAFLFKEKLESKATPF